MNRSSQTICSWMNRLNLAVGITLGLSAWSVLAQEATTNETAATAITNAPAETATRTNGFPAFQVIVDRNIFNSTRTARSRSGSEGAPKPPPPRIDVIALAGTMIYDQGQYAFFNSTASEFRKAAKVGDQIAGYTLKEVEQSHVSLGRSNEVTELQIGEQLRREGQGEWKVTTGSAIDTIGLGPTDGATVDNSSAKDSQSNSTTTTSEGPSDALKRLLEKRKKEISK